MDALDRLLQGEDEARPSPELAARVMEAVRREAERPAPIPFPWRRLVVGMVASALVYGGGAVLLIGSGLAVLTMSPVAVLLVTLAASLVVTEASRRWGAA